MKINVWENKEVYGIFNEGYSYISFDFYINDLYVFYFYVNFLIEMIVG